MADFRRLQEEQTKEIARIQQRIAQWEKFEADYRAVQERLNTLPDKLSHNMMVPLGKYAFMPGKLYHSNEILVLLGDNWFAKTTAKHAVGVAERRRQYVLKQLNLEKSQLNDLQTKSSITSELQEIGEGTVDIREEYVPSEEDEWRRKRGGRRARKAKEVHGSQEQSDTDVWRRLSELEKEEEEFLKKEKEEEEASVVIPVVHTREEPGDEEESEEFGATISSPADIFRRFHQPRKGEVEEDSQSDTVQPRRSVKWQLTETETETEQPEQKTRPPLQMASVPFSGMVIEREHAVSPVVLAEEQRPKRKVVSKFKQSRQKS